MRPELAEDIGLVRGFIDELRRGEISEDEFRPKRLRLGIYGQRQPGVQMVRIKVPYGGIAPDQMRAVAAAADEFSTGVAHVTTRQDFQLYSVKLDDVVPLLGRLAETGLTTREACGNTVRNVTACPVAGLSPTEPFDVTPYAAQVSRHFLRHALTQSLPRKFKIGFDGCANEGACIGASFHDIAAIAAVRDGRRGFRLYVGGGLGNTPKPARLFEEWTAAEDLVRTAHGIVEVFNAKGNRQNKNRARLKFLVQTLGWEEFRRQAMEARGRAPSGPAPDFSVEETPPPRQAPTGTADPAWLRDNVLPQKQEGYSAVTVALPLGDVTSDQLRGLADLAAHYADGRARLTIGQNVLLRWVSNPSGLWKRLRALDLAEPGAGTILDITACPGADTCTLGITSSKGLARALRETLRNVAPAARGLSIKISGCPNSCGQHHVADIGLHGAARRIGELEIPSYNLLLGGTPRPAAGDAEFGLFMARIPARLVPQAVLAIADVYARERRESEPFRAFVQRVGTERLQEVLAEFGEDPTAKKLADLRVDWGQQRQFVTIKAAKGECAVWPESRITNQGGDEMTQATAGRFSEQEVAALNGRFETAAPQDVLKWAIETFGRKIALAWSGAEDIAVLDMMWRIDPAAARVFTLDTGRLNPETYDLIDAARRRYGIEVEVQFPDTAAVEKMVREHGVNLFYRSIEDRKLCCGVRKVEPLKRILSTLDGWITGLRRTQAITRTRLNKIEIDGAFGGIIKVNPLADWTTQQVFDYIRENNVPKNRLHDQGYPSIGCAPCTRAVRPGEDERAGRWWWENPETKECGLHVKAR